MAAARLLSGKGGVRYADDSDEEQGGEQPGAKRQRRTTASNALTDDRFGAMFKDREFEIDMDSEEYKQLHPNAGVSGSRFKKWGRYLTHTLVPILLSTDHTLPPSIPHYKEL